MNYYGIYLNKSKDYATVFCLEGLADSINLSRPLHYFDNQNIIKHKEFDDVRFSEIFSFQRFISLGSVILASTAQFFLMDIFWLQKCIINLDEDYYCKNVHAFCQDFCCSQLLTRHGQFSHALQKLPLRKWD